MGHLVLTTALSAASLYVIADDATYTASGALDLRATARVVRWMINGQVRARVFERRRCLSDVPERRISRSLRPGLCAQGLKRVFPWVWECALLKVVSARVHSTRTVNLPSMLRPRGRPRPFIPTSVRDDPLFTMAKILVLGSVVVMLLHVMAVTARTIIRPESGALVDVFALLDAGQERTLAAWWTGALLVTASLAAAVAASVAAKASASTRDPFAWWVLAAIFALLSFDEIVSLHERGARWTGAVFDDSSPLRRFGWLIPGLAVVLLSLFVLIPAFRAIPRRSRNVVILGLGISIAGAMGLEVVGVLLDNAGAPLRWHYIVGALEEATEMAGVLVVLAGVSMAVRITRADGALTLQYHSAETPSVKTPELVN